MNRALCHRASLRLALLAALLQALAQPLAHARVEAGAPDICTAQGVLPAPSEAPGLPGAVSDPDHCALCLQLPAAGVPPSLPPLVDATRGALEHTSAEDPLRLAPRFALRDAHAPPLPGDC